MAVAVFVAIVSNQTELDVILKLIVFVLTRIIVVVQPEAFPITFLKAILVRVK
jgi:hypothetical protein